jgi:hypothetical protein
MLSGKSTDFKTLVLLRVTKKLIENTESYGIYRLEKILTERMGKPPVEKIKSQEDMEKERKKSIKEEVKQKLQEPKMLASKKIEENEFFMPQEKKQIQKRPLPPPRMPPRILPKMPPRQPPQRLQFQQSAQLPEHLRYLQPTKTMPKPKEKEIDLGELNPFLQDPNVKTIETAGEDDMVMVSGSMGKKPTGIKLSKEEIDEIIDKFSKKAKIPKSEGLFKVTVDNMIFTAMISDTISPRFIIKKI